MIREAVCVPPNPESLLLLLYSNQVHAGWQKLHVIADNYQLLILTAPVVPARSAGKFWAFLLGFCIPARSARKLWAFYSVSDAKKAKIF